MQRLWILCVIAACTGNEPTEPPVPPDTFDTFSTPDGWTPIAFSMSSTFGYDASTGTLHGWTVDGAAQSPVFALQIWSDEFEESCTVVARVNNPEAVPVEAWDFRDETPDITETAMKHWGWVVPSDVEIGLGGEPGCDTWNAIRYGEIETLITGHLWGAGVGTLRSDLADTAPEFEDVLASARDAGTLFGGSWISDVWTPNIWASHVALGGRTSDWSITLDEDGLFTEPVMPAELDAGLPTGVYAVIGVYSWDFDAYLP